MVAGISAGMNYLYVLQGLSLGSRVENFDIFLDVDDRFLISINPRSSTEEDTEEFQEPQDMFWSIFNALCRKVLVSANRVLHKEEINRVPETLDSLRPSPVSENSAAASRFPFGSAPLQNPHEELSVPPRREFVWRTIDRGQQSLATITQQITVDLDMDLSALRRLSRTDGRSTHRCAGYVREEITLATTTLDSVVVAHDTPSPLEICPICHEVVSLHEAIDCICGDPAPGSGHTIKCRACQFWSHTDCVGNPTNFTCRPCTGSQERSPPRSRDSTPSSDESPPTPTLSLSPGEAPQALPHEPAIREQRWINIDYHGAENLENSHSAVAVERALPVPRLPAILSSFSPTYHAIYADDDLYYMPSLTTSLEDDVSSGLASYSMFPPLKPGDQMDDLVKPLTTSLEDDVSSGLASYSMFPPLKPGDQMDDLVKPLTTSLEDDVSSGLASYSMFPPLKPGDQMDDLVNHYLKHAMPLHQTSYNSNSTVASGNLENSPSVIAARLPTISSSFSPTYHAIYADDLDYQPSLQTPLISSSFSPTYNAIYTDYLDYQPSLPTPTLSLSPSETSRLLHHESAIHEQPGIDRNMHKSHIRGVSPFGGVGHLQGVHNHNHMSGTAPSEDVEYGLNHMRGASQPGNTLMGFGMTELQLLEGTPHFDRNKIRQTSSKTRINEASFKCPLGTCTSTFTARHNLLNHINSHNKYRPHRCMCGMSFTTQGVLNRHRKRCRK
ncbi:hypothetical protein B0H19DRAFT_109688 [Mycena capillaripes]|nr:hypothetical protein B0H19DRAFT_109688 [Mycena capillaripes]